MATYSDQAGLILLFGEPELIQLTDRDGSTGAIVVPVLNRAMDTADSEVDSYIGASYTLPLPSVTNILRQVAGDIVRYRLYDDAATKEVIERYEKAIAWLRDVAKGLVSLGIPTGSTQPTDSIVVVHSRDQVFTDAVYDRMGEAWP